MRTESVKADAELAVFREFCSACPLKIDVKSAVKREPPEPDIACEIDGEGSVRFELVEICDSTVARALSKPEFLDGAYIRTSDPSWAVVAKKLAKRYPVDDPVDLLCYVSNRVYTPDSTVIPTLAKLLSGQEFQFRRVWLHGKKGVYRLWPSSHHRAQP